MSRRSRILGCLCGVSLLLAGFVTAMLVAAAPLREALGGFLDVGERPIKTDYVLPLAGGENTRPFAAAALVRNGLAREVLLPHALSAFPRIGLAPHQVSELLLTKVGIPIAHVSLLPLDAENTAGEARALAAFLEKEPAATVTVVTNTYHSRRAKFIFGRTLGERSEQLHYVTVPGDTFNASNWWHDPDGFRGYLQEPVKLLAYHLVYGTAGFWILGTATVLLSGGVLWATRWRRRAPQGPARRGTPDPRNAAGTAR